MPEVTTSLPTRLPRVDLTCENDEDIQFIGKISRHEGGYITQTMEELIRDVYYEIYPNHGSNTPSALGVINISSDYIDLPEDPMIQVLVATLRGTALDYAVAEALEWTVPKSEGGKLDFTGGAVYDDQGARFAPSCSNSIAAYFIGKHQLSVEWVPYGNGGTRQAHVGERTTEAYRGLATGDTLQEAVARYMVQSVTPRPYVSIPYSLLSHNAE